MEELLERLEYKIKEIAEQQAKLRQTNQQLDQRKTVLAKEKQLLLAKHEKAIFQIKTLVHRLKTIEQII